MWITAGILAVASAAGELVARTPEISSEEADDHVRRSGLLHALAPTRNALANSQLEHDKAAPTDLVLMLHGAKGKLWPARLTQQMKQVCAQQTTCCASNLVVFSYRWADLCGNYMRTAANAQELGRAIGRALLQHCWSSATDSMSKVTLIKLHLISHSAGAFVADAVARSLVTQAVSLRIVATFLDPFCLRGLFDFGFGRRHFGKYDIVGSTSLRVEHFYCRNNGVPSTGSPLWHAHFIMDVTDVPERERWMPCDADVPTTGQTRFHWWPVDFYIQNYAIYK
eukprot:gb/GEZN01014458.1/.p1 GENE.gb/GEZN01014458.1/~~gb/GEZN01014458.1/.p1  ORF type:complete len:295 (+),score=20.52 gb/GEZN01014458.1/:41-886(+)